MITYLALIAGLVILVVAGDLLVRGAVGLAERLGIPALIIGLTVVAFGTSAPELVVSMEAAASGAFGLAIGNVVGSNIANILLVLGAPSLIFATACSGPGTRRNALFMVAVTLGFIALASDGELGRLDGVVMISLLGVFLYDNYRSARRHRQQARDALEDEFGDIGTKPPALLGAFLAIGLIGLPLGANLTIFGATEIARSWGVSETAIGLTIVAIGTSLPELVASIMAACQRQSAVAVGNVIGSNIFNLLAIMGTTSLVFPLAVPDEIFVPDMWIMVLTSLALLPFIFFCKPITRPIGAFMVLLFSVYVVGVLYTHGF
uniref:calcium/sodium antiporter n=1 Tax=Pararhizobium sp. IMCC3301 TaxID=3067904 RepID=UPI00274031A2|nr:calcium/sodium antiporter [Pararhizobium sp. IMCC3301]